MVKFNDLKAKFLYIQDWHNKVKLEHIKAGRVITDIKKALVACKRKHYAYYGNSKYMPHQGVAECERRRRK